MPFSAAIGVFVIKFIYFTLLFVFMILGLLLGANVDWKNVVHNLISEEITFYIGVGFGIIVGWFWLWVEEYD